MLEMWEEENFLFQLKYVLPEVLLVCQFKSWGVDFFRILPDVFKPATEWLGFSLSSLRLPSTAIQEEVIKKSLHYTTDGLPSWYFTQHTPSCCQPWSSKLCMRYQTKKGYGRLLMIQLVLIVPHALIVSKLVDVLNWKYKLYSTGLCRVGNVRWTTSILTWVSKIQLLLMVIQILHVKLLVEYLRWKFKLVSPGLWSVRSDTMTVHSSVLSCDINGHSESNLSQLNMGTGLSNTTIFILSELRVFSEDFQLIDKMLQQGKLLCTDIIPQVTWNSKSRNILDIPCLTLHRDSRSFSCTGYLIWQLGYSLRADIEMVRMESFKRGVNAQKQVRSSSCFAMQWGTATSVVYLSKLSFLYSPLLTPEVFARLATHERIILNVSQFLCNYLHLFYRAWYFTPHCKNLTALYAFDLSEYYLPCYPAMWKFVSNGDSQLNEVLVFTNEAMRYVEFLELLRATIWLAVKGSIRISPLGVKVMLWILVYLLISEARTVFSIGNIISSKCVWSLGMINVGIPTVTVWMVLVVADFRQPTPRVVTTVQVQSGATAYGTDQKLLKTPISLESGDTLTDFRRQWQHWFLGQHLWLWSVIFLPELKISVHTSAAMGTVANAITDYHATNFDVFRHVDQRAQMSSVPGLIFLGKVLPCVLIFVGLELKCRRASPGWCALYRSREQHSYLRLCSITTILALAYGSTIDKGDSGQYNSGFTSSQLHRQAPKK